MPTLSSRSLAPLVFGVVAACAGPDRAREIGLLNGQPERSAAIDVPAEVSVGDAFVATVMTFGSGNCTGPAGEEVTTSGSVMRLVPFDEVPTDGETVCLADLAGFSHAQQLRVDVAGPAILRVVGYFGQGDERALDSVDVSIDVRP